MRCERQTTTKRKGLAMCDARKNKRTNRDMRFAQLMTFADEGDESARADLFREYEYEYVRGSSEVGNER